MQGVAWAEGRLLIREALWQRRRSRWDSLRGRVTWGFEVRVDCPRCGRPRLRQGMVERVVMPGGTEGQLDGSVRLCGTRGCRYAAFRDPDGGWHGCALSDSRQRFSRPVSCEGGRHQR